MGTGHNGGGYPKGKPYKMYFSDDKNLKQGAFLFGWKQIAAYIGVSPYVAKRWYQKLGFPVLRFAGKRVCTSRGAIDNWVMRLDLEERRAEKAVKEEMKRERADKKKLDRYGSDGGHEPADELRGPEQDHDLLPGTPQDGETPGEAGVRVPGVLGATRR